MPLPMTEAPRIESAPAPDADSDLVRRAAGGDMRAFETLYRRHSGRVHGAVWRLSGMNEARAEELTQEAFVRAWQKLSSFRFESAFSTWLHRLAVNVALMDLRARAVLVLHDVEGWKHEEIGRELGMAVGSSKAQLHRARGLLRGMLGDAS